MKSLFNKVSTYYYLVFFLTLFLYSPTLNYNFVWDDEGFVINNESVHHWKNIPRYFTDKSTFVDVKEERLMAFGVRPFRNLLFLVQYYLFYLMPRGWHFVNIILHAFNCILLYNFLLTLSSLVKSQTSNFRQNGIYAGLAFLTLWWAFHPVNTEVVAWVKSQDDLLSVFFFLLYLKTLLAFNASPTFKTGLLSFLLLASALLTKESMVSAPAMGTCLLLTLYVYGSEFRKYKSDLPLLLGHFILTVAFLIYRHKVLGQTSQVNYLAGNLSLTMASMGPVWTRYFQLILWPYPPTTQIADYVDYPLKNTWKDIQVAVGYGLLFIVPTIITAMAWKKRQWLVIGGLLMFFAAMLPVSNIVPMMQLLAERFLYFPLLGLVVALTPLALKFASISQDKIRPTFLIGLLILTFSGTVTLLRLPVWKSDYDLMEATVQDNKHFPYRPAFNYAIRLFDEGQTTKSYTLLNKIYERTMMGVYDLLAYSEISSAYHKNHKEAKFLLRDSQNYFRSPLITEKLADYELRDQNSTESIKLLEEVIQLKDKPSSYQHVNLAKAYLLHNETTKALEQTEKALLVDPADLSAMTLKRQILTYTKNTE